MDEQRWERWVRAPQQERARASFERVLDAAAQVIAKGGYDGFAIAEICRRAGVAPGTLYDRVEDRAALFLAVHDRELERITARAVAAVTARQWSRWGTPRLLDEVVALLAEHYDAERPLLRAFILRAAVDPRVRDEGAHYVSRLEAAVLPVLLGRDLPPGAVRAAYRLIVDSLSWRTAFGADFHADAPTTDTQWTRRMQEDVRAYLLPG